MIRDNIKLSQNFSSFFNKCPLCLKSNHFVQNCSKVHHIPDKNFLISKLNNSKHQIRIDQICIRKLKRSNFRKFLSDTQYKAMAFQKNMDEEKCSEYSEPEKEMYMIQTRSLENFDNEEPKVSINAEAQITSPKERESLKPLNFSHSIVKKLNFLIAIKFLIFYKKSKDYSQEEKTKPIVEFPSPPALKKRKFSIFSAKDETNQNHKEAVVLKFFDYDFDFGMEFKAYFPQFNMGKVLQILNCDIEAKSPIRKKMKTPKRFKKKKW